MMQQALSSSVSLRNSTSQTQITCSTQLKTPLSRQFLKARAPRRSSRVSGVSNDMLAGLKNALKMSGSSTTAIPSTQSLFFTNNAPSWEELQQLVDSKAKEQGFELPDFENGPANSVALRRTFGQPGEPRIKLYRDHATWCPYCHKIVLQLEEKRIPYTVEKINMRCYGDKPREFLNKVPSGLLPVMEIDGKIITESAVIQQLLEQMYPEPAMLPKESSPDYSRASKLMRLERRLFSDWLQWLCNGWSNDANKAAFIATMDAVNAELGVAPGPYFLTDFSLVDITFAPFLERIIASIAYYKGFYVRGQGSWPNLERWFDAMESREPYKGFRSDYYTHVHDLPPQLGGCVSIPEAASSAAAIDGTDGVHWSLPLPPLSGSSLPEPFSPGESLAYDRWRAAAKLVGNHAAVVPFALRAVGQRGPRPVSAALCDPTAIPGLEHFDHADGALRHVAYALLMGAENAPIEVSKSQSNTHVLSAEKAAACLAYVRDRVCVPRDLPFPSARQFRAHMNYFIEKMSSA